MSDARPDPAVGEAQPDRGAGVDWRLYLVTDPHLGGGRDAVPGIAYEAVLGGVGVVQVRDKESDDDEFAIHAVAVAEAVARACTETGRVVPVFVNDRLDVARELGLHLHVGQRDIPFARARSAMPDHLMVGLSIESDAQLGAALAGPGPVPDVIGVSPVWATATKTDTAAALGPEGADRLARAAHAHRAAGGVRAVGIGGVTPATVARLAATELDGICVVSAIMAAPDPRAAAAELIARWEAGKSLPPKGEPA
ncbi:thiamine phosphate synthase [Dietzia cinnamea]|uniref:thiamine phosphate synthase n=1 Tax=Dietzia cinnamea TaxID=321318 RepID=UPI0021A7CC23|nr:thiamine phosphate synthase [Dietzia cinnamea]MCT1711850.1 thiamine phosphate synthase [Dietzia cinnamea]